MWKASAAGSAALANISTCHWLPTPRACGGRFSFSLLLSIEFDIYLIDEGMPASADVEFNRKAGNLLQERLLKSTVVIVSHSPKTLEKFCRSAAVLKNGKLYQFETLEEAKRLYDYQS